MFVAGADLTIDDVSPLELGSGSVEVVKEFKNLGSLIEARGGMTGEVDRQIAQASKAFGELHNSVFLAGDLSLETKRLFYQSVVLGVLLYGGETWAFTQVVVKKLDFPSSLCDMHNGHRESCAVCRAHYYYSVS